ncbi:hypothetical protein QF001_001996 [Paraburkholderia youngii]
MQTYIPSVTRMAVRWPWNLPGKGSTPPCPRRTRFRFAFPRSYLFCHHMYLNLRNLLATSLLSELMFYVACDT